MAEERIRFDDRVWFVDPRSPARRLGVSTHPEAGVVVLSLWQGEQCTGTFRLRVLDADILIDVLTEGMTREPPPDASPSPSLLRRIK
jgi:hypothetical protein